MELTVEIDELVVEGADIDLAAFTAELTRLVRERGVPLAAGGDRDLAELTGLPRLGRGTPAQLGVALARTVHAGLGGWSR